MTELKWHGVPLKVVPGQWYRVIVPTVRAVLLDEANNPVSGQECVITGPNGFRVVALTDSRGRVSIPAPVGEEYHISFVHLDQDVWTVSSKEGATAVTASETRKLKRQPERRTLIGEAVEPMAASETKETAHVIQPGECVESVAFRYGVLPDMIWEHEKNAELRKMRQRRDVLLAGDDVFIPSVRLKTEAVTTQRATTFVAKRALRNVRLKLVRDSKVAVSPPRMLKPNEYDNPPPCAPRVEPWANAQVQIVCQGFSWAGQTDGDGKLRAEVPMGVSSAEMIVAGGTEDERHFELQFGKLDPLDTPSGLAQRLSNLGFRARAMQELTPELVNALKSFQYALGLPVTGEVDERTRAELQK